MYYWDLRQVLCKDINNILSQIKNNIMRWIIGGDFIN